MRVAVVGASGNSGTALLRALSGSPEVTSVLGVARRMPPAVKPYRSTEGATFDIASGTTTPAQEETLVDRLAQVLAGADSVVHLAWLIQPNHERDTLRRANVEGTRRVAQACVRAGVGQFVAASSVGAYSPVHDDVPRDASWPAGGVPTSHYSVDKAAQERVLDELEAEHPAMAVARLRPSLIFQRDAGAEVGRFFLGPFVPRALLAPGRLPLVPLPRGLRLQAVHADDVAQAYLRVVVTGARAPFNIPSDPVLDTGALAGLIGRGPLLQVPPPLVRRVLWAGWSARLVAADPGWLDMAMSAPVMDTSRARSELGWFPRHSAPDALTEMLRGLSDQAGHPSPPLHV